MEIPLLLGCLCASRRVEIKLLGLIRKSKVKSQKSKVKKRKAVIVRLLVRDYRQIKYWYASNTPFASFPSTS
jgi:hypothetical protein